MKKHLSLICKVFLTIALISSIFLLVACQQEPEIQDKELGSILGHVFYSNGEDHSGIVLTLDKTDGLMAITQSDGSRAIVSMAVSNEDGSFAFYNLEPGTYTIYASSNDSVEKAVSTNVVVSGKDIVTAADLLLTATGSLSGNVILDESKTGNIGFLVFLAGTSYMAVTDDSGYYCISNVPAGENYQLIVSKGGYISSNVVSCSVTAHAKTSMSEIALLSDDILSGSRSLVWKGSLAEAPAAPKLFWAYFNTTDGCSYLYDGTQWSLLAAKGDKGEQGLQGETGANGTNGVSIIWRGSFADASEITDAVILNVYFNTTDGCSYIYDGTKWTYLAVKGATGETGAQGSQGEPGVQGPQGEAGADGANGVSIAWIGEYADASEIKNAAALNAYFNTTDGCSYIYDGSTWKPLALKGATGEQGPQGETGQTGAQGPQGETGATGAAGENGISIVWRGNFADASEIENVAILNVYFNTTDGCSYIYDGTKWTLLAAKGATGETGSQGPQGETGATGTSITWKGSFATAPSEPGLYWAYFNTDDGCSYIFDGTDWTLLAAKGATGETGSQGPQGETGATGASGANGVSIIWRGSFADASEIENAVALNAYFNTTDGCSYIYDGTNWTLLAAKGATGAQGENGHTLIKDEAVAPTCTQTGLTEGYHCALCGEVIIAQETVPVVAHTWGDGVVTTAVQETTDGVMTYTCTVCGATKEEAIHCTGGDWKFRQVNGNPEKYKTCADCGEEICEAATYDEMFYIQGTVLYPQYDSALDKTAIITGDWIIPSSIGESTINVVILYNQDELTGLTPPDTVTYIGIENCPNLRYLYIPASVSLDAYTLQMIMAGCASDVVIEISPDHENFKIVDGMLLSKDGKSFISPLGLSGSVTIPDGVTTIEENAFYYNQIVTEVILPESVTTIGDSAFSGPSIARVNIPDGVTTIGDEAFYGSSVTEITIPASVTMLGDYVFSSCENLRTVSLLLSLESIGSQMFYGCTSLESITIPSSVTSIGEYAFSQCTSLESITLPSSLERIEDYAFEYCSGLKSISIPASVTYIGDGAFSRCAGLYVEVDSANEYYLSDNGALYNKDRTELLLDQVTSGDVVISSSVTSIGYAAFAGNSGITSLSIPNTVTSIGYSAFADCENLTEVTIAINGNLIANGAFYGTSAHVTIETGSKGITYGLFNGCDATGITIPETVTYISGYAFANMTAAITITLPASLSSVETFAFIACGCDIVFASGTTNIPHNVLYRSDIRHITIPVSITSLYKSSFESCYLTDITYEGTQEQWAAVTKESGWEDCLSSSSVIHCTDGDVTN